MPWARFEDRFPSNRKIRKLDDAAFRLYVSAICWSAENLTDGVVEVDDLPLVSDVKQPSDSVQTLVRLGLWEVRQPSDEGGSEGWFIHDYFEYNPTAEQVRAERALKTARQQRWREGRRAAAKKSNVDASTDGLPTRLETLPRPAPTRPVVLPTEVPKTSPSPATPDDEPTRRTAKPKSPAAPTPEFEAFWKAYPRKVAKGAAIKAWNKALKDGADPQTIIGAAAFYALERKMQDPTYTKHPATWLNAACWQDEPDPTYTPPTGAGGFEVARTNGFASRPSTTDQRVAAGLELAAYYRSRGE